MGCPKFDSTQVDADPFTRRYYEEQGQARCARRSLRLTRRRPGLPHVVAPEDANPAHEGPSGGIGSAEDSLRSVYSISPQKKIQNSTQGDVEPILRYQLRLVNGKREDAVRTFTLNYFLADGTCAIREPPLRNSGHVGGSSASATA